MPLRPMITPPVGEVRALDELADLVHLRLGMVDDIAGAVDDFREVMRQDVGRHADRDTGRAVHQQVGEREGSTTGSWRSSSKFGWKSTVFFLMSASI